jgi:hypothetical protein
MILTKTARLFLAAAALCAAANATSVFNFDNDGLGTSTGFTDTNNGISATFTSTADPGSFVVYASMFDTLTGNVLGDPGPAGQGGLALAVNFSTDLASVSLDFATADFGTPSPLIITGYENSTLVGSTSATGSVPAGYEFPEGAITFSGGPFNNIVISSAAPDFAVDNIDVTAAPEPAVVGLVGLGLLSLAVPVLRRRFLAR